MSKIGVTIGGRSYDIEIEAVPQSETDLKITVDGTSFPVTVQSVHDPESLDWILIGNRSYEVVMDRDLQWIEAYGRRYGDLSVVDLEARTARPASRDGRIKAPIPGIIMRILVSEGQQVSAGQSVVVLEAMKMENEVRAPRAGVVRKLNVTPGQGVMLNELLAEIE